MLQRGEHVVKLLDNGGAFEGVVLAVFQTLDGEWHAICEGPAGIFFMSNTHSLKSIKKPIILVSSHA